jgi:predicted phage terminase large subunit-like protein
MTAELETEQLLSNISSMTHEEMASLMTLMDELDARKRQRLAQMDFLAFIAAVDPAYKFGVHLKRLGALLMQVEEGEKDRIAVSMAPRFGKSQMISIYYPAWYLGKHPDHKLIVASHTVDLAVDMARKVRNLMQTAEYKSIFPGVQIAADAKAAGKWNTTKGGEVYATGVGGALAGRGAHLIVVDDPISEQDIKSGNTTSLDGIYEWFRSGLRTRLMPGGKICVLHCMTGDTRVTLASGEGKPLKDVRPGDMVASYDNGTIRPAKVLGWANQGVDHIYSIALKSGVILRGNERHPFLVNLNGVEQWIKVRNLKPGMSLVSTTGATDCRTTKPYVAPAKPAITENTSVKNRLGGFLTLLNTKITHALWTDVRGSGSLNYNPVCVLPAKLGSGIGARTQMQSNTLWGIMGNGRERFAVPMGVTLLHMPKGCVFPVGTKLDTLSANLKGRITARIGEVIPTSKQSMGSLALNTTVCSQLKTACAQFVANLHTGGIPHRLGQFARSLLTTAIQLAKSGHCSATLAISSSKSGTQPSYSAKPLRTLSITLDEIVSITPDGDEDVFDIQVEGTENFLANGVVSHNTRWHQRDLIGRLIKDGALNEDGDQYEIFEFPAILEIPNPKAELDHMEYSPEEPAVNLKSLWPAQWSLESLLRTKASMPAWQWNAQYQQNPTAQESAIIKKDDIQWWPHEDPPSVDFIVQAYDTALTTNTRSDYSVCVTFGVWTNEDGVDSIICLNCVRGKWEFPELKKMALEQARDWEPDAIIVEAKASGQPLIDEMRRSGLFVQDYSPGKGQDKIARLNSVSDMFTNKQVWFPEIRWATEVVDEILAFPSGENDDQVDAVTLALIRIRKGGLIRLGTDILDTEQVAGSRRAAYY